MALPIIQVGEEEEVYGYEFAFTPEKPIAPEDRQKYQEAQKKWLEEWKPYPWHFRQ